MFNDALKQVTGLLDRRFLLNIFFPCLIFCGLLVIVAIVGSGGNMTMTVATWNQQDAGLKILQIVGSLSVITVLSGVVDSQLPTIVRFYEGYPPLNRHLATIGKTFHQNRLKHLGDEGYLSSNYPHPSKLDQVMPTRFGNILKNSEQYPKERYGLDSVVVWPRLYHLFPDRFIQIIGEAKGTIDFMLVISTLSSFFALVTGIYLLIVKASGWLFLLCFWGGLAIAWLAYQGALASAALYAQQIKTGFDLYRQELLKQMHLKLPHNLKNEKEQWKEVYAFLYQNFPRLPEYTNSSNESSDS
jgi:hypothetical protein